MKFSTTMRSFLSIFIAASIVSASAEPLDKQATNELIGKLTSTAVHGTGISFHFKEKKIIRMLKTPVLESGVLVFFPPDRFKKIVESPRQTTTLCDGTTVWIVFPEDKLVERYPLDKSPIVRDSLAAISSAIEPTNLTQYFDVSAEKKDKDYILTLVPLSSQFRRTVDKMFLTLNSKLRPTEIAILSPAGDRSQISLSNEKRLKLTNKDFHFEPKADMKVSSPLGE